MAMPRYFMNVRYRGRLFPDEEGDELANEHAGIKSIYAASSSLCNRVLWSAKPLGAKPPFPQISQTRSPFGGFPFPGVLALRFSSSGTSSSNNRRSDLSVGLYSPKVDFSHILCYNVLHKQPIL